MTTDEESFDAMAAIQDALDDAEFAIRSHPDHVAVVYEKGSQAFRIGQERDAPSEPAEAHLAARYGLAMAFISAWHHLDGDKTKRDKAAQSAAMNLGVLGIDQEAAFMMIMHQEQMWRRTLRSEAGLGRGSRAAVVVIVVVIVIALVGWAVS